MRWLPFLFVLGCPVEPKDVQDLNQGNGNGGPAPQNQMPGGKPPGQPQLNAGNENAQAGNMNQPPSEGGGNQPPLEGGGNQPPLEGDGNQAMLGAQGAQPPSGVDGENIPLPPVNGENQLEGQPTADGQQMNPEIMNAPNGGEGAGINPLGGQQGGNTPATPNANNGGQAGTPPDMPAGANVLPMYQDLPQFSDIITGETITISLSVEGAASFDFEFVVKREGDGRVYPKVLHKESNVASPLNITAPASIDEPVWLVITADKTGDGPTPDDLVGGPTDSLSIAGSDLSLEYTLTEDSEFLKNLPWFSQATEGPGFQGGM